MSSPPLPRSAPSASDIELLKRLIAFATPSSAPTLPLADYLSNLATDAGLRVWRQSYEGGNKVNLLLRVGPDKPGEGLLLCGHIDVVPANEPDWQSDPFTLSPRTTSPFDSAGAAEPGWCGRGVTDMKGFVALAVNSLLSRARASLRAPLALLLTSDEEVGALGTQHLLATAAADLGLPKQVLIGEPTSLALVRMHKGHLKLRLMIRGEPAHSGLPQHGVNAIEIAGAVIRRLSSLAAEWRATRPAHNEHFPECPFPVLNLGLIQGGSAVNIVPARCVIDVGIRLLPGQDSQACLAEIDLALGELPRGIRDRVDVSVVNDNPPLLCTESAPICSMLAQQLGQTATLGVSYASDAGPLSRAGHDCVLWGPGTMEHAHRANEFLAASQFSAARRMFDKFISDCCESPREHRS